MFLARLLTFRPFVHLVSITDMGKAEMLKIIYNHVKLTMYLASLGWKTTPLRDIVFCLTLDSCKIVKEETKNKE